MVHGEGDSWWWRHRALAARTDWLQQSVQWERRTAAASLSCLHTHNVHKTLFLGSRTTTVTFCRLEGAPQQPADLSGHFKVCTGRSDRSFRVRNSAKIALTKSVNKHRCYIWFGPIFPLFRPQECQGTSKGSSDRGSGEVPKRWTGPPGIFAYTRNERWKERERERCVSKRASDVIRRWLTPPFHIYYYCCCCPSIIPCRN